jgi:hypothetical protein
MYCNNKIPHEKKNGTGKGMTAYSDKKGEGHKTGIVHIWLINIWEKHFVVIIKKKHFSYDGVCI